MATENVRQRTKDDPSADVLDTTKDDAVHNNNNKGRRQRRRTAIARRGLRSLAVAVAIPVSLHLAMFLSAHQSLAQPTSTWFPSPWILHALFVGSASLMGLCAWLVWAEGGFHQRPATLGFFLGYLALSLAWDPIVFGAGGTWVGLLVSVALFGALAGCCHSSKRVNPIAGDLALLCLVWAGFVVSLNLKLIYW